MSDLSFQQIPVQKQILSQEQEKRKREIEQVLAHLIRMRCECQNLQTAVEAEDFICIMDRVITFLRYASVILEEKLGEVGG